MRHHPHILTIDSGGVEVVHPGHIESATLTHRIARTLWVDV